VEKEKFIELISEKIRLVRLEQGISQEKMAEILGISKKTLLQIEKRRIGANWTTVVAFCALFNRSELLESVLGDDPIVFAQLMAQDSDAAPKEKTLGGKVWWKPVKTRGDFRMQQNVISHHFRILDEENYRWYSSFDKDEALKRLEELHLGK
jgi:DNA-binding XRE family transcriptional regulator